MTIRIRVIRCAVSICAALHAFAATAADSPVPVRLAIVTVASQMPLLVGAKKGIFRSHGFDVTVMPISGGVQANQALAANQADWSAGGIESTVVAASSGLPFKPYAMYAKGGDSLGVLVRSDAGIRTTADLRGKRIAVVSGTASAQGLSQLLKAAGIPRDAIKTVNATFGNMGQMLTQGAVDAMVGLEPFLSLTQKRMGDQAVLLERLGKYVQGGGFLLIGDAWAKANPGRLEEAVLALWEAEQFVRQHPAESAALESEFIKAEAETIELSSKYLEFTPLVDDFTRTSMRTTARYLLDEGLITRAVDTDALLMEAQRIGADLQRRHPELLK